MATYYVNPSTGNDSNPGTSGSPWKSVFKVSTTISNGDVVNFAAGVYVETSYITFNQDNITLIFANKNTTTVTLGSGLYFQDQPFNCLGKSILTFRGSNQTISGVTLDGQSKQIGGGLQVIDAQNISVSDVIINNCFGFGIWLINVDGGDFTDVVSYNNSWASTSWVGGGIQWGNCNNITWLRVRGEEIQKVGNQGGGIAWKTLGSGANFYVTNSTVKDCEAIVYYYGEGHSEQSPNIAFEMSRANLGNVLIDNLYANNIISLIGNADQVGYNGADKTVTLINSHVDCDPTQSYPLELSVGNCEIAYNYFDSPTAGYGIINWDRSQQKNWDIHHNVFENMGGGGWPATVINSSLGFENLKVYNNYFGFSGVPFAIIGAHALNQGGFTQGIDFANNIVRRTGSSGGGTNYPPTDHLLYMNYVDNHPTTGVRIRNNTYFGFDPVITSNVQVTSNINNNTRDPLQNFSGNKPFPYFGLQEGSNEIDAGIQGGYYYDGSAPDIGPSEQTVISSTCNITNLQVNPSLDNNGTYTLLLAITYQNPPTQLELTIIVDSTVYTRTSTGSGLDNISILDLPSDGQPKSVSVYFTNDNSCSASGTYIAPNINQNQGNYRVTNLSVNCTENGFLSWQNIDPIAAQGQSQIWLQVNESPGAILHIDGISVISGSQSVNLPGMVQNPGFDAPFDIPGVYRYTIRNGSYISGMVFCVRFKEIGNLMVTGVTDDSISLSWDYETFPGDESFFQFDIIRSTEGSNYVVIDRIRGVEDQLTNTYTDTTVGSGTTYYYKIRPVLSHTFAVDNLSVTQTGLQSDAVIGETTGSSNDCFISVDSESIDVSVCDSGTYDVSFDMVVSDLPSDNVRVIIDNVIVATIDTTVTTSVSLTNRPCLGQEIAIRLESDTLSTCNYIFNIQEPTIECLGTTTVQFPGNECSGSVGIQFPEVSCQLFIDNINVVNDDGITHDVEVTITYRNGQSDRIDINGTLFDLEGEIGTEVFTLTGITNVVGDITITAKYEGEVIDINPVAIINNTGVVNKKVTVNGLSSISYDSDGLINDYEWTIKDVDGNTIDSVPYTVGNQPINTFYLSGFAQSLKFDLSLFYSQCSYLVNPTTHSAWTDSELITELNNSGVVFNSTTYTSLVTLVEAIRVFYSATTVTYISDTYGLLYFDTGQTSPNYIEITIS